MFEPFRKISERRWGMEAWWNSLEVRLDFYLNFYYFSLRLDLI